MSPVVRVTCGSMARDRRAELARREPGAALGHRVDESRLVQRAAVGERGVGVGELQRRDEHVALADREARVVAAAPDLVVVVVAGCSFTRNSWSGITPGLVAEARCRSARRSRTCGRCAGSRCRPGAARRGCSSPARSLPVPPRPLTLVAVGVPELVADRVEVHVARHRQRAGQVDGAEHGTCPRCSRFSSLPEVEAAVGVVDSGRVRTVAGNRVALQHRERRDQLERRARRVRR